MRTLLDARRTVWLMALAFLFMLVPTTTAMALDFDDGTGDADQMLQIMQSNLDMGTEVTDNVDVSADTTFIFEMTDDGSSATVDNPLAGVDDTGGGTLDDLTIWSNAGTDADTAYWTSDWLINDTGTFGADYTDDWLDTDDTGDTVIDDYGASTDDDLYLGAQGTFAIG